MEKKQDSINWLLEEINKQKAWADPLKLEPIIEQAKEMENSQKKEMYVKGLKNYDPTYLNEIYGGNNSEVTMSNKKQSSVEWLEWQINLGLSERGLISAFKEAKAMHKEEIIDAYWYGGQDVPMHINTCKRYYNETFGGEK